jgi:hypothetical protein
VQIKVIVVRKAVIDEKAMRPMNMAGNVAPDRTTATEVNTKTMTKIGIAIMQCLAQ